MTTSQNLRERARALSDAEFAQIPWVSALTADEREHVRQDMLVTIAQPGDYVVRIGRPVTYWFGLIEGLLKMSNDDRLGSAITFTGIAPND